MLRPRASSPFCVELRVSDGLTGFDLLTDLDDRALIDARALVAADELVEAVLVELVDATFLGLDLDPVRRHGQDRA